MIDGKIFMGYVSELEPIEVFGIAKLLDVPVGKWKSGAAAGDLEDFDFYDAEDILKDVLCAFMKKDDDFKSKILAILKSATEEGDSNDGAED